MIKVIAVNSTWIVGADKKDNQYLQDIVRGLKPRLKQAGLIWRNCVADTVYSSGENYAFLEQINLQSFIPPHGIYNGGLDGFEYNEEHDHYVCPQGEIIPFKKIFNDSRTVPIAIGSRIFQVRTDQAIAYMRCCAFELLFCF